MRRCTEEGSPSRSKLVDKVLPASLDIRSRRSQQQLLLLHARVCNVNGLAEATALQQHAKSTSTPPTLAGWIERFATFTRSAYVPHLRRVKV